MKKRILSIMLAICMVITLIPQVVFAASSTPSVTAYATKKQLMDGTFAPNSNGTAANIGKLVFGKNSSGSAQEWYILGQDTDVSGDNTVIFAAGPMVTGQMFSPYSPHDASDDPSDSNAKYIKNITIQPYLDITYIGINNTEISKVYINHYGTSDLRMALRLMASSPNHFTEAEQVLMNATTVTTTDMLNENGTDKMTYTTTDKLYAPAAKYKNDTTIKAGSSNNKLLAVNSYWSSADAFWLRSPNPIERTPKGYQAFFAGSYTDHVDSGDEPAGGDYVSSVGVTKKFGVRPASNIDLSSVLFASAATASSGAATFEKIEKDANGEPKAMTLRLDGSSKNIGTVTYSTATGDIKATKGSTTGDVALVVQGKDGANDWYYSKKITETETVNVSAIQSALNLSDINLSTCKIWLETTEDNVAYAVSAKEAKAISSVGITGINTPEAGVALDTEATCETTGVSNTKPAITWAPNDSTAGYNTSYTASVTLTAGTGYEFAGSTAATINGKSATSVTKNTDGALTVTYKFGATAKDKLISITPQSITVANGTAYDAMNLPATVGIVTEGNTVTSASVTWDTTTPASGSYDPDVLTEQTVTLNGTVTCPDNIDDNGVTLTTTITITISAAGIVGAPTASPASGTYTENQSVTLTSSTEGAEIYYTTDGSEPKRTNGTKYTGAIPVTANPGQSITTTIRAIAVKDKMQDSGIATFTYTITAKDKLTSITAPQAITVANGTAYDAMNLPATVGIVTEGNTVTSASVTWDTTTPASGSYDPDVLTEQTVTLNGTVTCPDNIDDNGVTLTTTITITISAAGIVGAPTASPASGTYTENQSVTLTSSTEGGEIYYTIDGTSPSCTNGTKYTEAISVTGTEGKSVQTTIKAIAVKNGMQNSDVVTFTYTIKIPAQQNTGGGGGGYVPPVQKPIVKNDDNATTSADLSDTTSASGDTTTANIDKTIGDEIVDKAVANESKDIVIDATAKNTTAADSTTTTQVGIPTNTLGAIAEKTEADVTVKTDVAEIKMDNAAAGAIAEQAAGDTVQIILEKVDEKKNKVEFQLKVVCSDGNVISDFKGGNVAVTVTVPKDMAEKKVVCVFIDDNGRISKVKGQKNADGTYTFFTGHFSTYALMTEEEADTAIAEQKEEIHAKLDSYELVARSMACKSPSGKKAIRIRVYDKNGLSTDFFDGIEIYRSTKKNTGYGKKPIFVIKSGKSSYYNTAIKSGTKYYYRVRGFVIIDGQKYYTDYSLKAIRTAK